MGKKELIQGGIAAIALSGIISLSSWILSLGDYSKSPPIEWALGTGLTMIIFGGLAVALGAIISSGIGAVALAAGGVGILGIAALMIGVSEILSSYNWDSAKYPTLEWSKSVGAALIAFPAAMMLAAPAAGLNALFKLFGEDPPVVSVAQQMIKVAEKLSEYNWDNVKYPTLKWATGVGTALTAFAGMNLIAGTGNLLGKFMSWLSGDTKQPIEELADTMIRVAYRMNDPIWSSKLSYPTKEWSEGVGIGLSTFANTFKSLRKATS